MTPRILVIDDDERGEILVDDAGVLQEALAGVAAFGHAVAAATLFIARALLMMSPR